MQKKKIFLPLKKESLTRKGKGKGESMAATAVNAVNVWIGDCLTLPGSRCVFINKPFSVAFIAATCECSANKCFELIEGSTLSEYQFGGGLTVSAEQTLGDSVDIHQPLLPGISEEVRMVDECKDADVLFKLENTDVGGLNGGGGTYEFVLIGEPPPEESDIVDEASTSKHFVACGRANFARCTEEEGFVSDTELHETRCCSDVAQADWLKNDQCDVWAASVINGQCHHDKTYDEAAEICSNAGARLCTSEELKNDCTKGSGCVHDRDLIWSSSKETSD